MNLPFYISIRYLFSKKGTSTNAIHILSTISILGMTVGTMALITILSVFNGFEDLVLSMYNSYSPDLKIIPLKGKTFVPDQNKIDSLTHLKGVKAVSEVVEENALFRYNENELIGAIKGVDDNYINITRIDTTVIAGDFLLKNDSLNFAVIGAGIEFGLSVNIDNIFSPIKVYTPKRGQKVILNPEQAFNQMITYPSGVFAVQLEFDAKYIFVSIDFARKLLGYTNEVSFLEVNFEEERPENLQNEVQKIFGSEFKVVNRLQQDEELYKVLNSEKWIIYFILTFVLFISAFNMIGSLSMMVMDKARDISILRSMGSSTGQVRRIFLSHGILQVLVGFISGTILALVLCWLQQHFKLVSIEGSFVIDAYPVSLKLSDIALVFITILTIGILASWYPAKRAAQQKWLFKEE